MQLNIRVFKTIAFVAVTLLLALSLPKSWVTQASGDTKQLFHILLSLIALGVLVLAGIQAGLCYFQERALRRHAHATLLQHLPSVEKMENVLFQIITSGFVLLTLLLGTSIYFYADVLNTVLSKFIFSIMAWLVFLGLLCARKILGLRGRPAILTTIVGIFLLVFGFVMSQHWI